jgi:hypothetical protein
MSAAPKTIVVCEDGFEYIERFRRFVPGFDFVRAGHFAEALALAEGAAALLLDQDFRRTPRDLLVDASGLHTTDALPEVQGILILRALRARAQRLPALLFADLDDAERASRLERELAPLSIVPSTEGLGQIASRLRALFA